MRVRVGAFDKEGVGGGRDAVEAGWGRGRMSARLYARSGLVPQALLAVCDLSVQSIPWTPQVHEIGRAHV